MIVVHYLLVYFCHLMTHNSYTKNINNNNNDNIDNNSNLYPNR